MERSKKREIWRKSALIAGIVGVFAVAACFAPPAAEPPQTPALHKNITATVFWIGEGADGSNDFIHNASSTWVENWTAAYGGVDDPNNRCGDYPCDFTPKENPFYVALPYNDLKDCQPKPDQAAISWFDGVSQYGKSFMKNHWVEVRAGNAVGYGQIADVGPFGENDFNYVHGDTRPAEPRAGIDLSPALAKRLNLDGMGVVSWRFVNEKDVPAGQNDPWKKIVTHSEPDC